MNIVLALEVLQTEPSLWHLGEDAAIRDLSLDELAQVGGGGGVGEGGTGFALG